MVRAVFGVLGTVGVAIAQFSGPAFDPDTAPFFGVSNIVYPTTISAVPTLSNGVPTTVITPTSIRTLVSYGASSVTRSASISGAPSRSANSTMSRSLSLNMSSASVEPSSSASSSSTTSASRTSTSAPAQSSAAGVANVPVVVGAIAGGMFAGLALL